MDWLETRIRRLEQLASPLRTRTAEVERSRRATTQGLFYLGRQQVPEPEAGGIDTTCCTGVPATLYATLTGTTMDGTYELTYKADMALGFTPALDGVAGWSWARQTAPTYTAPYQYIYLLCDDTTWSSEFKDYPDPFDSDSWMWGEEDYSCPFTSLTYDSGRVTISTTP